MDFDVLILGQFNKMYFSFSPTIYSSMVIFIETKTLAIGPPTVNDKIHKASLGLIAGRMPDNNSRSNLGGPQVHWDRASGFLKSKNWDGTLGIRRNGNSRKNKSNSRHEMIGLSAIAVLPRATYAVHVLRNPTVQPPSWPIIMSGLV